MYTMRIILFFLLVFNTFSGYGQETIIDKNKAAEIIKSVNESILNARNFSAKLHYSIFKNHNDTVAFEQTDGFYKRNNENEHSVLLGVETIQNQQERLMVDTNSKTMLLSGPNPKVMLLNDNLNNALQICKKITLFNEKDYSVIKFYLGEKSGTGYSAIEVRYANADFFIQRLTIYCVNAFIPDFENFKNPKIQIDYNEISTSRIPASEFEISGFLEKRNNTYVLQKRYKAFDFSNQLIITKSKK